MDPLGRSSPGRTVPAAAPGCYRAPVRRGRPRRLLLGLGVAALAACSNPPILWRPSAPLGYGTAPAPFDAASLSTTTPIKHVVFIIKENRSFDNLFGRFPGANGTRVADDHGTKRPLTRGYDQRLPHDLPHDYIAALKAYDGGKMDGFNQSPAADQYAFTQMVGPSQLPNYWHWARQFVLGDDFF